MWRMHDGNRVLTEAEWAFFRAGLDSLRDQIETDIGNQTDEADTGVPVFDRLTPEQKLTLLAEVALAVRDPGVPIPRHTAANEGALVAVLDTARDLLRCEVEAGGPGETRLRQILLAAIVDSEDCPERLPEPTSTNWEAWNGLFECLEVRVLWDYDFAMGDQFLDLPPDAARAMLQDMGIDRNYYLAEPAEPGRAGLVAARQTLARLIGLPVPDDAGMYPALVDLYHDLFVGPVSPEQLAAWAGHPWVEVAGSVGAVWDCDYPSWQAECGGAVPAAAFRVDPTPPADAVEPPGGVRVELCDGRWVVRNRAGEVWCDLIGNGWTDSPDEDSPAVSFPTAAEAKAAYAQAVKMYDERAERHAAAAERLGIA